MIFSHIIIEWFALAQDKISARYSNDMAFFKQEEDYNFLLKKVTKLNLFSISHKSERKLQQRRRVGKIPGLPDERQEKVGETMLESYENAYSVTETMPTLHFLHMKY